MRPWPTYFFFCIFSLLALFSAGCSFKVPNDYLGPLTPYDRQSDQSSPAFWMPVPEIANSPSRGARLGVLNPVLFKDKEGELRTMLAPSGTWNDITGPTAKARFYRYLPSGVDIELIGEYSTRINRGAFIKVKDPYFFSPDFFSNYSFRVEADPTYRFFGFGPKSKKENETNYSLQQGLGEFHLGYRVSSSWSLNYKLRLRAYAIDQGGDADVPFIEDVFPDVYGLSDDFVLAQSFFLSYDRRLQNGAGLSLEAGTEVSQESLGSGMSFVRYWGLAKGYYPVLPKRIDLTARIRLENLRGSEMSFVEQASLGGPDRFRAFSLNRFVDKLSLLATLEPRILVWEGFVIYEDVQIELAPFLETGTVEGGFDEIDFDDLIHTGGIGFRMHVLNLTARVDIGFSDEGKSIFTSLGYPF